MTNLYKSNMFLILSFILLFTCKYKEEHIVEQNIYNAIFNDLLDSTIIDYRSLVVPSPSDFKNDETISKLNEKSNNKINIKRKPLIIGVMDNLAPDAAGNSKNVETNPVRDSSIPGNFIITITLDTSYVTNATDLAIARTIESLHAYLTYITQEDFLGSF